MADLKIIVEVRADQTISNYSIPQSGKLVFKNASTTGDLLITPKEVQPTKLPFCKSNGTTADSCRYGAASSEELSTSARTGLTDRFLLHGADRQGSR